MRRTISLLLASAFFCVVFADPNVAGNIRALQFLPDGDLIFAIKDDIGNSPTWNGGTSPAGNSGFILRKGDGTDRFREIYAMLLAADLNEKKVTCYSTVADGTRNVLRMVYLHQ